MKQKRSISVSTPRFYASRSASKHWVVAACAVALAIGITGCTTPGTRPGHENLVTQEVTMNTRNSPATGSGLTAGRWDGFFEFQGMRVDMIVDFDAETMSIPAQHVVDSPIDVQSSDDRSVSFQVALGGGVLFSGTRDGDVIEGAFRQPGAEGTFRLQAAASSVAAPAPAGVAAQAKATARFESAPVVLTSGEVTIHGTATLPSGRSEYPVVLIISGSGPTDRDGNSSLIPGRNDSLKLLGEGLAEHGIASVRYDKRGIGESAYAGQREQDTTFDMFVADAVAWIRQLRSDPRFSAVGVIGHSEGSLIGIIAARRAQVDALVSIAGAGRPMDQIILDQLRARVPDAVDEAEAILDSLRRGVEVEQVSSVLEPLFRPSVQPFVMSELAYDPAREIAQLAIPVQIVSGTRDLQADPREARILAASAKSADLEIIDGMNHILKDSPDTVEGNIATYSDPSLPVSPQLVAAVSSFLEHHLEATGRSAHRADRSSN